MSPRTTRISVSLRLRIRAVTVATIILAAFAAPWAAGATLLGNPRIPRSTSTDTAAMFNVYHASPVPLPGWIGPVSIYQQTNVAGHGFHLLLLRPTGVPQEYTVVYNSDRLELSPAQAGGIRTFVLPHTGEPNSQLSVLPGDLIAHFGTGIPFDISTNADVAYSPAGAAPAQDSTITLGSASYPVLNEERVYSLEVVYDAVPEPSGALFLLGLAGAATIRRRRS